MSALMVTPPHQCNTTTMCYLSPLSIITPVVAILLTLIPRGEGGGAVQHSAVVAE